MNSTTPRTTPRTAPRTAPRTEGQAPDGEKQTSSVDLLVGGMTCASCVARVEKKLNRLAGGDATVNPATASAREGFHPPRGAPATLGETVGPTRYTAAPPPQAGNEPATDRAPDAHHL